MSIAHSASRKVNLATSGHMRIKFLLPFCLMFSTSIMAQSKKKQIEEFSTRLDSVLLLTNSLLGRLEQLEENDKRFRHDGIKRDQDISAQAEQLLRVQNEISFISQIELEIDNLKNRIDELSTTNDSLRNLITLLEQSQNNVDKIEFINDIMGEYVSNQQYFVEYANPDPVTGGPKMEISITKSDNKILFTQYFIGDQPYGCSGPHTEAIAEILSVEKIGERRFVLETKKIMCNYSKGAGCDDISLMMGGSNYKENFVITIDFNDRSNVIFNSTIVKDKCPFAWDFRDYNFKKNTNVN